MRLDDIVKVKKDKMFKYIHRAIDIYGVIYQVRRDLNDKPQIECKICDFHTCEHEAQEEASLRWNFLSFILDRNSGTFVNRPCRTSGHYAGP